MVQTTLTTFLENEKIRKHLNIGPELHAAILQNPKAVEQLSPEAQQKINSMMEKTRFVVI